ncbi:protease FtsH subunit HflC [Tranquillimonas rosea]|uniref:Protease FtsH subunit HflC n=1 Tax=Tranquillimonas rosea TaxID=641238 RepID=A0A1H9WF30_9RHOB|nr:SPFH domain-containing protein [Tranquillimonas rosea]SES32063.1 protease FtsH subunit HflC [Tranquillimonas rosea]
MRKATILIPIVVVAAIGLLSSIFIVDERENVLVLQFGQIKQVKEEPGLGFKVPLIQDVVRYDDRILSLDTEATEVTPADDRRLVVDAFARYRIDDVVQFREAIGVGGLLAAENRLGDILNAQIRAVLGSDGVTSNTILSEDRSQLMERITEESRSRAEALGLYVIDVRLKQTNLPTQNLDATFARMRAEREREAADEIARGEEAAQRVRALADRTVVELVSDAEREAEITRGQADAERNRIFAEAFGANPEFFEFYRSLTAYTRSLRGENSTLVLTPDSEFFDYLKTDQPREVNRALTPVPQDGAEGADQSGANTEEGDGAAQTEASAPEAEAQGEPEQSEASADEDSGSDNSSLPVAEADSADEVETQ